MSHELTLHMKTGVILVLRSVPNGIDAVVFAHRHIHQRIVFSGLLKQGTTHVTDGQLNLNGYKMVATYGEFSAIKAFVALAEGVTA